MKLFKFSHLIVIALVAVASVAGAQNADPFRVEWREQKLAVIEALGRIKPEHLAPSTAKMVKDYIQGDRIEKLKTELENSAIEFTEATKDNPEGHNPKGTCAHTAPVSHAPIFISKMDCGNLAPTYIWQTLIASVVVHEKPDASSELADYVAMALVKTYNLKSSSDPSFVFYKRYATESGNSVIMHIDPANGKVISIEGDGIKIAFKDLPRLLGKHSTFRATGVYDSFSCRTWSEGIVRFKDGTIGYGEIDGTSRSHTVEMSASFKIELLDGAKLISVSGTYDKQVGSSCALRPQSFAYTMAYFPATPQEIEAERLAGNTDAIHALLKKDPSQTTEEERAEAETLFASGVSAGSEVGIFNAAVANEAWKLVERVADNLPADHKFSDVLFVALDRGNIDKILSIPSLRPHLDFSAKRNYVTVVGKLIEDFYKTTPTNTAAWEAAEEKTAATLKLLFDSGFNAEASISDIRNRPRTALTSLVAHFSVSPKLVEVVLGAVSPGYALKPDERDRTAMDYLTVFWNELKDQCKSPASENSDATRFYDDRIERFNKVYSLLMAAGHDGKRRGRIYYRTNIHAPRCIWDAKRGSFRVNFSTDYETKPWNERKSGTLYGNSPETSG